MLRVLSCNDILIETVAGRVYEGFLASEEARRLNAEPGWTFDVRWPGVHYVSETDWTRVEGARLSDADLDRAIELAARWTAGDWTGVDGSVLA